MRALKNLFFLFEMSSLLFQPFFFVVFSFCQMPIHAKQSRYEYTCKLVLTDSNSDLLFFFSFFSFLSPFYRNVAPK